MARRPLCGRSLQCRAGRRHRCACRVPFAWPVADVGGCGVRAGTGRGPLGRGRAESVQPCAAAIAGGRGGRGSGERILRHRARDRFGTRFGSHRRAFSRTRDAAAGPQGLHPGRAGHHRHKWQDHRHLADRPTGRACGQDRGGGGQHRAHPARHAAAAPGRRHLAPGLGTGAVQLPTRWHHGFRAHGRHCSQRHARPPGLAWQPAGLCPGQGPGVRRALADGAQP